LEILTKIEYFNTGFVFLRHKIQTDIKQKKKKHKSKGGELINIEKKILLIVFEMGRTRPKCMGWAKPSPTTWAGLNPARVNSALHCSHAT
jgi:hypothetical protein